MMSNNRNQEGWTMAQTTVAVLVAATIGFAFARMVLGS